MKSTAPGDNMQGECIEAEEAQLKEKILLSPEAEQLASVIDQCISQVKTAAALTAFCQLDIPSGAVDEELTGLLKKHQALVDLLETQEGPKQETQGSTEEEGAEMKTHIRTHLEKDIKNSVRNILRYFRTHPDVAIDLETEVDMGLGENEEILIANLELFQNHTIEKLQASRDEEPPKPVLSPLINDLKQIIIEEEKRFPVTMQRSEQFHEEQGDVATPLRDTQEPSPPQLRTQSTKQSSIQQEIVQLNAKLYNLMVENEQKETVLHEKNEQVEAEIEYLLKDFDKEMAETQNKLESMIQIYEKEKGEIKRLEDLCAAMEKQYNQIQEKRRQAEEKRQQELRDLELKTKAAIYAQSWWRGYRTRKEIKSMTKAKKGKKGKKGKK